MFPYTVENDHKIGDVGLSTLNMTDSGEGPSVQVSFTFSGEVTIAGKQGPVDQKGQLTISTTNWNPWYKGFSRPDKTIISYHIIGSGIETEDNENLDLQSPRGIEMRVAIKEDTGQLGIVAKIEFDAWKTAFG